MHEPFKRPWQVYAPAAVTLAYSAFSDILCLCVTWDSQNKYPYIPVCTRITIWSIKRKRALNTVTQTLKCFIGT